MSLRKPDTGEGALEMVADEVPDGDGVELLRSVGGPGLKLITCAYMAPVAIDPAAIF